MTEGVELHQQLLEKLADVPTPAGPTPRELEEQKFGGSSVIPLNTVQRRRGKAHEL